MKKFLPLQFVVQSIRGATFRQGGCSPFSHFSIDIANTFPKELKNTYRYYLRILGLNGKTNGGKIMVSDIEKHLKLHRTTVWRILNRGKNIFWIFENKKYIIIHSQRYVRRIARRAYKGQNTALEKKRQVYATLSDKDVKSKLNFTNKLVRATAHRKNGGQYNKKIKAHVSKYKGKQYISRNKSQARIARDTGFSVSKVQRTLNKKGKKHWRILELGFYPTYRQIKHVVDNPLQNDKYMAYIEKQEGRIPLIRKYYNGYVFMERIANTYQHLKSEANSVVHNMAKRTTCAVSNCTYCMKLGVEALRRYKPVSYVLLQ